jgi:hypothetical protein
VAERHSAVPRYELDDDVGHPNQGRDTDRGVLLPGPDQLDVRACPTWPLHSLLSRERLTFERVVEVDLLGEDDVNGASDLLLDRELLLRGLPPKEGLRPYQARIQRPTSLPSLPARRVWSGSLAAHGLVN